MNSLLDSEHIPGRPGARFEPYVRLVHCLVPRTMYVAMFGPAGDLVWSTEPVSGPDLMNVVDDALLSARSNPDSPGQVRLLPGNLPVYLCSLRDDTKRLLAVLAVVCRATETRDRKSPDFAFAYTLLSRSEEHTSELQSQSNLVCRLLLEKKKMKQEYAS